MSAKWERRRVAQAGVRGPVREHDTLVPSRKPLPNQRLHRKVSYSSAGEHDTSAWCNHSAFPRSSYVVVYALAPDGVVVGDPAAGIVKLDLPRFRQAWTGTLLLLKPPGLGSSIH